MTRGTNSSARLPRTICRPEATKGHIDPKVLTDIKPDETVEQAENSREMLKYKRAKARRAYKDSAAAGEMLLRTAPKPE